MGNMEKIFFEHRSVGEFECKGKLLLLLIAKEPLQEDKETIFSSLRGMNYLVECDQSNYKLANTHLTFIKDSSNKIFTQTSLDTILEHYAQEKRLTKETLIKEIKRDGRNGYQENMIVTSKALY